MPSAPVNMPINGWAPAARDGGYDRVASAGIGDWLAPRPARAVQRHGIATVRRRLSARLAAAATARDGDVRPANSIGTGHGCGPPRWGALAEEAPEQTMPTYTDGRIRSLRMTCQGLALNTRASRPPLFFGHSQLDSKDSHQTSNRHPKGAERRVQVCLVDRRSDSAITRKRVTGMRALLTRSRWPRLGCHL